MANQGPSYGLSAAVAGKVGFTEWNFLRVRFVHNT